MNAPIVMYARARYCPDVARARARLTFHALEWTEHDIECEVEAAAAVDALTGQRRVPTLVIGDNTVLVEPTDEELYTVLADAGLIHEVPSEWATG